MSDVAKLLALPKRVTEPNAQLVDFLREKLAQAEAGTLQHMLCVYGHADERVGYGRFYGDDACPARLIGEIHVLATGCELTEIGRRAEIEEKKR